ncbi:MAG: molybdopterin dinucleotide binding domain-containing protein [Candidatus Syntropharchaeia archaeon]
MEISKFIKPPEYEITIVTYADIFQPDNKFSEEYRMKSAVIILDPEDMKRIGVKEGKNVKVFNEYGSVVVVAKKSEDEHKGLGFMPNGIYANALIPPDDIPKYKGINAKICIAEGEIPDVKDVLG